MKIEALRIHLDSKYTNDTTDIWFSSRSEYNGSMINNAIMIIKPDNYKLRPIGKNNENINIIIVSEMLFAYILNNTIKDTIIVGIPNYLSKNEIKRIDDLGDINKIYLILDYHSALHNSYGIIDNLKKICPGENIEVGFSIKNFEIPGIIKDFFIIENKFQKLSA